MRIGARVGPALLKDLGCPPAARRQTAAWSSAPARAASLPTSPPLALPCPRSRQHTCRAPFPGQPPLPGALPRLPGYSRDLLQDGEHSAPGAGSAGDERLVVHNHPLVVVPAEPGEGALNRPRGHSAGCSLPPALHTARHHGARWPGAVWPSDCHSDTAALPAVLKLFSHHVVGMFQRTLAPCCLLRQRSLLPGSLRPCAIQVWCL